VPLSHDIRMGAIREAEQRREPSVLPVHVLLALLDNDEVFGVLYLACRMRVERSLGPPGAETGAPVVTPEAERCIGWCATRASARRVGEELLEELGFADEPDDQPWNAVVDGLVAGPIEDLLKGRLDEDGMDRDTCDGYADEFSDEFDDGAVTADFERPQTVDVVLDETDTLERALTELDRLIGLDEVKDAVRSLADTHRVNAERTRLGLPAVPLSPHLVFTGNPGTGKTTVARIVARVYRHLGLVEKGHLVETDRAGLIGPYLGQTALKTKRVIKRALGGVLFIDEAYALVPERTGEAGGDQYGDEAISALLKEMEDRRGEFVVIVAGYRAEMARFVRRNPGLESRFQRQIDFPDYSTDSLIAIFEGLATSHQIELGAGVRARLAEYIDAVPSPVREGNGRFMRNLFEAMYARMASRALEDGVIERHEITMFTTADVPETGLPVLEPDGPVGMYL